MKTAQNALLAAERAKMEAEVAAEAIRLRSIEAAEINTRNAINPPNKPSNVVVIEHQDAIGAFMASRDFGKEAGKARAILVEFIKFDAQFRMKRAA